MLPHLDSRPLLVRIGHLDQHLGTRIPFSALRYRDKKISEAEQLETDNTQNAFAS